jgi:DNA-binding transcriptional regulator YiaG
MGGHSWTAEEDKKLHRLYPGAQWIGLLNAFPGRTRASIQQRANFLEIKRINGGRTTWTGAEKKRLAELYRQGSKDEILRAVPRHSWGSISKMANALGMKRDFDTVSKHRRHPIVRRLRNIRRERGIKLVDLAIKIGIHWPQLSAWESGRQRPRFLSFLDWVSALECELALKEAV